MKKYLYMLLLVIVGINLSAEARTCQYCGGKGYTVKNQDVAGYGLAKTKKKCTVCGEWVWSNTAHTHVPCSHCHQTGQIDSENSSNLSGSYGNVGRAEDRLNAIAEDNPRAYATAMSLRYGSPMLDAEYEEYRHLPSDVAQNYLKLRNVLEGGLIHFNEASANQRYRTDSPQRVEQYMNEIINQCSALAPFLAYKISSNLKVHLENIRKQLGKSGEAYLNATLTFNKLNNMQDQIDNYILRMNSF